MRQEYLRKEFSKISRVILYLQVGKCEECSVADVVTRKENSSDFIKDSVDCKCNGDLVKVETRFRKHNDKLNKR